MKKVLVIMLVFALLFSFAACTADTPDTVETPENPIIRLSTTTSVNDSGLMAALQPEFEAATGYTLEVASAGTGAAIEAARDGNADCLLVHSKSQEAAFTDEGYGEESISFMYNYFVVIGPAVDLAGVTDTTTASEALNTIADNASTFLSRGDSSGTHSKEVSLWVGAGLLQNADKDENDNYPTVDADWYQSVGQGMGATLNMAQEMIAYTISDKATFLANAKNLPDLAILLEKSDEMLNTYSMIAVSTDRYADTNIDGANAFIEWMSSDAASEIIAEFGLEDYNEQLFYVD